MLGLTHQEMWTRAAIICNLIADVPEDGEFTIVAGRNVDTTHLPKDIFGVKLPQPSIEHTIKTCQVCEEDIWLGPEQVKAAGVRLCYRCTTVAQAVCNSDPQMHMLNPTEHRLPRRT